MGSYIMDPGAPAPKKAKPAAAQPSPALALAGLVAAARLILREAQRTDSETCLSQRAHKTLNDAYVAAGGVL